VRRATAVASSGNWPADAVVGEVTLAFDQRHRRRIRMTDDAGEPFLLDLAKAVVLADGDGLAVDGDGYIRVRAAAEPVADVGAATAAETARLAWHIGNRHTPVQVLGDGTLRIRDDHVLVAMLEGLGATVTRRLASFTPEPGAYAAAGDGRGHDH
jgi:urease accessory protein